MKLLTGNAMGKGNAEVPAEVMSKRTWGYIRFLPASNVFAMSDTLPNSPVLDEGMPDTEFLAGLRLGKRMVTLRDGRREYALGEQRGL
jgi:hypothetical protein